MESLSLFQVFEKALGFFTKGATIAPEVIQLVCLVATIGFVWLIIRPIFKLMRGNK